MFISYAQNLEDVVLRRALADVKHGTYVDVGAADPVIDSTTYAFYSVGFAGVNVEPLPWLADALRRQRPKDTTFAVAAGAAKGSATLFAANAGETSTFDLPSSAKARREELTVAVVPLDELLVEAGLEGRQIHFCTIDVDGAGGDVLEGFDLDRWRPWILVVEAEPEPDSIRRGHEMWEPRVFEAGYRFCLFNGLNRFYVRTDRDDSIGHLLSYPACALDQPFERAEERSRRLELAQTTSRLKELRSVNAQLEATLSTITSTVSWRVTRPLRVARRAQRLRGGGLRQPQRRSDDAELRTAFARRLLTAAKVLVPENAAIATGRVEEARRALRAALLESFHADDTKAFLALVAVDGSFPRDTEIAETARTLRMDGPDSVMHELEARFATSIARGSATMAGLRVVKDTTVIDVTHTVGSEFQTGIQRVVRETVARWIIAARDVVLATFDADRGWLRAVTPDEEMRLRNWRDAAGRAPALNPAGPRSEPLLLHGCRLVLPELVLDSGRCEAYRALASTSMLSSLSLIGYDLIAVTASETTAAGFPADFLDYLSVVKHADRVSAISETTAREFAAFAATAPSQGLRASIVKAHPLPTEAPRLSRELVESARERLGLRGLPLVLVVGSHEPRKNHVRALEAAERLWRQGLDFELLLIGGLSWKSEDFNGLLATLVSLDRPITVIRGCGEDDLWGAYHTARFTVFPSLVEGFGLPIAESLAAGTPVITSGHGSMAELAGRGGCLTIDPYDIDAIEQAMHRLLTDDRLLDGLRAEARARPTGTWDEYAADVWEFLVDGTR